MPRLTSTPINHSQSPPLTGFAQDDTNALPDDLSLLEGCIRVSPHLVVVSNRANRLEASYSDPDYDKLAADVLRTGGNVVPVLLCRLPPSARAGDPDPSTPLYSLVYGHRRHRACLKLGVPLLAHVWSEDITDQDAYVRMLSENQSRSNLCAYEFGGQYSSMLALEPKVFVGITALAESIGRAHSDVSRAIALWELPADVVSAFESPADLQYRDATPLRQALAHDRAGVLARARKLIAIGGHRRRKDVLAALCGNVRGPSTKGSSTPIIVDETLVASLVCDSRARISIVVEGSMSTGAQSALVQALKDFFARDGGPRPTAHAQGMSGSTTEGVHKVDEYATGTGDAP